MKGTTMSTTIWIVLTIVAFLLLGPLGLLLIGIIWAILSRK